MRRLKRGLLCSWRLGIEVYFIPWTRVATCLRIVYNGF